MTIGEILDWIRNYKINTHAIASLLTAMQIVVATIGLSALQVGP